MLSGYQGDPAVGAVILDAVARVKAAQPGRGLLLRPGDGRRRPRHVRAARDPGVHARHRGAAGRHPHAQPLRARLPRRPDDHARSTRCWRPSTRSATAARATCWSPACCTATCPPDSLDVVAVSDAGAWAVDHPAAADHAERLRRRHRRALPRAPAHDRLARRPRSSGPRRRCSPILEATLAAGTREIQLVAAQDAIADPPTTFTARQLR